ncbi:hypothetical protein [Tessaracoccus caeni]|uniref:hypothetical protein n=1 Tax=Tessaracoccus caeni TaxID=3031239 RepID=UPI0023DB7A85|nr:hypothetical protein [Tessaracoccus caeni]MDF1488446.1 hypothetical protein [Tessaracoccus caeni]
MIPLHGIASRHDLPLPFWSVLLGAALVLVLTFWVGIFAWRTPRYAESRLIELPRLGRVVDSRLTTIALWAVAGHVWILAAAALLAGPDRIDNPVVGFIYVWLWVGLVVASVLFGRVYARINPARALVGTGRGEATSTIAPAALALLAFLYLELVHPDGATLPALRIAFATLMLWLLIGLWRRGKGWITTADPFDAYAGAVARMSVWTRSDRGVLAYTSPLSNLASWRAPSGLALLSVVLLGGTLFDALSNTAWWVRLLQRQDDGMAHPLGAVGLLGSILFVGLLYLIGCRPLRRADGLPRTMDALAPGLVPLMVGYALSHYGTMLYLEGQRTAHRFSDPLGRGWNLFGGAEAAPDVTLLAFPTAIAIMQVALIVGGHVLGVLVTHDISLQRGAAVRAQVPLLVVMIGFTVGGLLLMFGA